MKEKHRFGDIPEGIMKGNQRIMAEAVEKDAENKCVKLKCHLVTPASLQKSMMDKIPVPSVGDILREEFMNPFGITADRLAEDIQMPISDIQDILHDHQKITEDTSLKLAKYFGVSDRYFSDMQNDIDIRKQGGKNHEK